MLPDYEIKRTTKVIEKIMPYIEFILILIIIQSVVSLFFGESSEEDAIRFRILAHSNAPADQAVKEEIQREIAPLIENAVEGSRSVKELSDNLEAIEETMIEVASAISTDLPVSIERTDALFPPKRSGLIIHPQAAYDAYIITIGSGRGDNWWCSLFPKVCFVDKKEEDDEKVTFFVWEWIKGLFSESY